MLTLEQEHQVRAFVNKHPHITIVMPRDTLNAWLAALRSGKYKQGRHQLITTHHDRPAYCCLGVMQEVCGHVEKLETAPTTLWLRSFNIMFFGANGSRRAPAIKHTFGGFGSELYITTLNDDAQLNFEELAKLIEAHAMPLEDVEAWCRTNLRAE